MVVFREGERLIRKTGFYSTFARNHLHGFFVQQQDEYSKLFLEAVRTGVKNKLRDMERSLRCTQQERNTMPGKERPQRHGPYHSPWCEYTLACMQRHGVSNGDIARHLAIPVASVQAYMTGKVRPPLRLLHPWGKRLRLSLEEHVKFQRLAFFAHTEPEVVQWLLTAERIAGEARERLFGAELVNRKLTMELEEMKAKVAGDV